MTPHMVFLLIAIPLHAFFAHYHRTNHWRGSWFWFGWSMFFLGWAAAWFLVELQKLSGAGT